MRKWLPYLGVIGAFLVYSFASVFTKWASQAEFMSWPYLWRLAGAVGVLGIYSILWQQIIKRMPVSDAYMFKGSTLIFILLLSHILFGEPVTLQNGIGAAIIVAGMCLYAKE